MIFQPLPTLTIHNRRPRFRRQWNFWIRCHTQNRCCFIIYPRRSLPHRFPHRPLRLPCTLRRPTSRCLPMTIAFPRSVHRCHFSNPPTRYCAQCRLRRLPLQTGNASTSSASTKSLTFRVRLTRRKRNACQSSTQKTSRAIKIKPRKVKKWPRMTLLKTLTARKRSQMVMALPTIITRTFTATTAICIRNDEWAWIILWYGNKLKIKSFDCKNVSSFAELFEA